MGLDAIELVMEVEDEFGITITDSEASEMRTIEDLVALCMNRIRAIEVADCLAMPCFLSLRRVVREVRDDVGFRMRPRDQVEGLLHKEDRRRLWNRLPELLGTSPRELRRAPWLRMTLLLIVLGFWVWLLFVLPFCVESIVLALFVTAFFGAVLFRLTIGFRSRTPEGYTTFGEITKRIVGRRVATKTPSQTNQEAVFSIVRRIVVEQLGVDDDEVVPTARFVEDLGLE